MLITKVGAQRGPDRSGLSAQHIVAAVEDSLRRLQTDHIDLYLSHYLDAKTPVEETVRAIGASNYDAAQFREALTVAEQMGVITYYSLALGFLTGKYRSQDDLGKSVRCGGIVTAPIASATSVEQVDSLVRPPV